MFKRSMIAAAAALWTGCGDAGAGSAEHAGLSQCRSELAKATGEAAKLKERLAASDSKAQRLEGEIETLRNGPTLRLQAALTDAKGGRLDQAKAGLAAIVETFPTAAEADVAKRELAKVEERIEAAAKEAAAEAARIEAERAKEEERRRRGWRALRASRKVTAGNVTVAVRQTKIAGRWPFDRYGSSYMQREADKGSKYLYIDFDVTTKESNPRLPVFAIYEHTGQQLKLLATAQTEFFRWQDYGTYLGNYHDTRNDFAKRNTVRFSAGAQLSDSDLERPLFVVVIRAGCLARGFERFRRPPVWYEASGCDVFTDLGLDDLLSGEHVALVHIVNRGKL